MASSARPSAEGRRAPRQAPPKSSSPKLERRAVRDLLAWYHQRRRALPWRRTRDPYAVWVSEIMLQQTRCETVLRYYEPFLASFPTVRALADATEGAVLARWSGLGYYRRARSLRQAAIEVVRRHGGKVPGDPAELLGLPGIGRYTAGAIASIAFDRREPVLDGNVARVLARLFEVGGRWRSGALEKRLWKIAASLVPAEAPGDWNQALMELGATVCSPRAPDCGSCPLRRHCAAMRSSSVERFPQARARASVRRVRRACVVFENRGRVLLVQRRTGGLLRGLWEFPGGTVNATTPFRVAAEIAALRGAGAPEPWGEPIVHTIMNERIECSVFRAPLPHRDSGRRGERWYRWPEIARLPLSTLGLRILSRCQ